MEGRSAAPPLFSQLAELKGQPLSIRFNQTISSKFHHLEYKILVEELGQPHFDVLKTPDAAGLRVI